MPRYLVERTFAERWDVCAEGAGERSCSAILGAHGCHGVSWLHSYLSTDRQRSYCIVGGPTPEAVRLPARASQLPVDDGSMNVDAVGGFLRSESARWAAATKEIGLLPE